MTSKRKSNSGKPYITIWLVHLIVYYFIYLTTRQFVQNYYLEWDYLSKQSLLIIFFSPLLSLMGWIDFIPGFAFIPFFIMYGLYKKVFKPNLFKSFVLSIVGCYSIVYIYSFFIYEQEYTFPFGYDKINTLFFMIPALAMSILINYVVFKKTYKRLKMENENTNENTVSD